MEAKILVTDDEVELVRVIKSVLELEDLNVEMAFNGHEAWAMLDQNPEKYNFLVSDVIMPRMSGIDLLKKIRQDRRFDKMPILLMSGFTDFTLEEALKHGAIDLVEKPPQFEVLVEIIKKNLPA